VKTFKDLEFGVHPNAGVFNPFRDTVSAFDGRALMHFDNNYGVSVISGASAYSDDEHPYEVAVFFDGSITYDTPITDDVIGYCTEERVTEIMEAVQALPKKEVEDV